MCIMIVLILATGLVTSAGAPAPLPPLTVYVDATVVWTFSGLQVQAGETVKINSHGFVCTASEYWPGSTSDPGGQIEGLGCGQHEDAPEPCALDDAPYGMLLGKIVSPKGQKVFAIGNAETFIAPMSGWVYLSINDNLIYYDDNLGHYLVTFK